MNTDIRNDAALDAAGEAAPTPAKGTVRRGRLGNTAYREREHLWPKEIERLLMAYSPRLQAILEASRKQIREGEVLSHEEFWAEVGADRASTGRGRKRKTGRLSSRAAPG